MVVGNVKVLLRQDLIDKYANAWDSIKSPSKLKSSIKFILLINSFLR